MSSFMGVVSEKFLVNIQQYLLIYRINDELPKSDEYQVFWVKKNPKMNSTKSNHIYNAIEWSLSLNVVNYLNSFFFNKMGVQ